MPRGSTLVLVALTGLLPACFYDREVPAVDNVFRACFFALRKTGMWAIEESPGVDMAAVGRARWLFDFRATAEAFEPRATSRAGTVPGPAGASIPVVIAKPKDSHGKPLPLVIWFHGGGYVIGNEYEPLANQLAAELPAVVVSVGYRLAPEHKCPAAVEDSVAALRYWVENGAEEGADTARVGVAGISAGGGLAAAVAQRARNESIALKGQLLVVPMMKDAANTASYIENGGESGLTSRFASWCWRRYCGDADSALCRDHACQPFLGDPRGTAPAVVVTAEKDVLRDEGVGYLAKLRAADVRTKHVHHPGTHVGAGVHRGTVGEAVREFAALLR
eukprot:TRINITY_DN18203_c0_g1_i1.p1 TRINITY_DN18203_c0_g1~~TRINITY_DN18203_c0_g1_i1.p1  ORF type:complete len:353 (+),score=101.72 TRINITY_DN18203_c0_g1_i1:60-1061(+)